MPLPSELALRFFFPPLGADVLLRFGLILPPLLLDATPVVHRLLVLLCMFVVHLCPYALLNLLAFTRARISGLRK